MSRACMMLCMSQFLLCCSQVVPAGSKSRLGFIARQMDVDILVTGGTHEFKVSMAV